MSDFCVDRVFYKGPITCCEYYDDNYLLIGSGPYLSVIDANTFEIVYQHLCLKYRIICGILLDKANNLICVYGEKAFNICKFDEEIKVIKNYFPGNTCFEIDDLIWTIDWYNQSTDQLAIVCAHNQLYIYNLKTNKIDKCVFCNQKCMIYSAKILNLFDRADVFIASGTIYNQVLIWDSKNGAILCTLSGHQGVIFNIGFDAQTNYLYSVSDDRSIILWQLNLTEKNDEFSINGQLSNKFYGHEARVWKCIWFRANQKLYLCSIGEDLKCCIWNLNEKKLFYRFNTIRKGSKNIWSLCINENNHNLITGWQDGGLRKYELKWYLEFNDETEKAENSINEWKLDYEVDKDYTRTIELIDDLIVCCTNQGFVYLISIQNSNIKQKLIFKDENLVSYNCMAKSTNTYLAIGSINGKIFLIKDVDDPKVRCIDCVEIETRLNEEYKNEKPNAFKIFSLLWSELNEELYVLASFTFLNGLLHLYRLNNQEFNLELVSRLSLPESKHRWLTSYALTILNDSLYIFTGDKCGNINFYKQIENEPKTLNLPKQTITHISKQSSSINGIYFKQPNQLICCSNDGFYYLFKIDDNETLELINKYEINSSIDLLQALVFDDYFKQSANTSLCVDNENSFDIEQNLLLALCFYGDKFLLWNFQLNRSIAEIKCGGANRSWSYELARLNDTEYQFKLIFLKQKSLIEYRKKFHQNELLNINRVKQNHLLQVYHGNNIACCLYFNKIYLLTGSEDTQIILSKIDGTNLTHSHHLQGHDSVVKCMCLISLSSNTFLLVTAGGKANMKLWKIVIDEEKNQFIKQIIQVCEFKRFSKNKKQKPWLHVDLESNPDIRFMHSDICYSFEDKTVIYIYFACSDGFIRIFKYDSNANKVKIIDSCQYDRCLLSLKYLNINHNSYIICTATDGHVILYQLVNQLFEQTNKPIKLIQNVQQSGINSFDVWQISENEILVATVGDDSSISVLSLQFENEIKHKQLIKYDMTHASSIMAVKFLTENVIITVAKDQRRNLWTFDYSTNSLKNLKVYFTNVADISSMDVTKLSETSFQVAIIGSGIEIINISVNQIREKN